MKIGNAGIIFLIFAFLSGILATVFLIIGGKRGFLTDVSFYIFISVPILLLLSIIFGIIAIVKDSNRRAGIISIVASVTLLLIMALLIYISIYALQGFR